MRVLVACEFSGVVRDAFVKAGHKAMSCDFIPTEQPGIHYQGDVRALLDKRWDLMIAHPPCTYLCNSGVQWLYKDPERWKKLFEAAEFFKAMLEAPIERIAVENPIMHKYARQLTQDPRYKVQLVHPWKFGHKEKKATCLWLKGLPELEETDNVFEEMCKLPTREQQRLHYLPPSADRGKLRSVTFKGMAEAMAQQWGSLA